MESNTRLLLDRYIQYVEESKENEAKVLRSMIHRDEVYTYEQKIGKSLIEMNSEEIYQMVLTFRFQTNVIKADYVSSTLKKFEKFFSWYANHVELIRNPCAESWMDSNGVSRRMIKDGMKGVVPPDYTEMIIKEIHSNFPAPRDDYYEMFIQLLYNGVQHRADIVRIKEEDIDFDAKTIRLQNATITVSDRCLELLKACHRMTEADLDLHKRCKFLSWRGSYVKFSVYSDQAKFNDADATGNLGNIFSQINKEIDTKIEAGSVFLNGFRDFLNRKVGVEKASEMLQSTRKQELNQEFTELVRAFGFKTSINDVKQRMRNYGLNY